MSERIGPTGESPKSGDPYDRGGLNARLGVDRRTNRLRLDFGTALTVLLMSKREAIAFADALREKASLLKDGPPR